MSTGQHRTHKVHSFDVEIVTFTKDSRLDTHQLEGLCFVWLLVDCANDFTANCLSGPWSIAFIDFNLFLLKMECIVGKNVQQLNTRLKAAHTTFRCS